MRHKTRLYSLAALSTCLGFFAANYFLKLSDEAIQEYDLIYITRYCAALEGVAPNEISENLVTDKGFDGNLYIFDADPVLDSIPAFEIGRRGAVSRLFCAPALGCILPPVLSTGCQSGEL